MSSVQKMQSAWVAAACCLVILGCSDRSPTAMVSADNGKPPAAETQSSSQSPAGSAAQAIVQSSPDPRWEIVGKTDEMTGTVTRFALYRTKVEATTVEVEMTCPEQGADGGLLQVTTYDGLLATAFDEVLGHPSATARIDTGDGEIRSIALMNSDKYDNVYFLVHRGAVQMRNALAEDIPILRDAPIGASTLALSGDPANLKLELELDNGTKRVVRGDATLAQYLEPCTSAAGEQRQQQKAEEQQQRQEAEKQRQKAELDEWARAQSETAEVPNSTTAPEEGEIAQQ